MTANIAPRDHGPGAHATIAKIAELDRGRGRGMRVELREFLPASRRTGYFLALIETREDGREFHTFLLESEFSQLAFAMADARAKIETLGRSGWRQRRGTTPRSRPRSGCAAPASLCAETTGRSSSPCT